MRIHHFYPRTSNIGDHFVQRGIERMIQRIKPDATFELFSINSRGDEKSDYGLTRSAIERNISWTATQNGRRIKLRYLGAIKNNAWLHTRCAAINLRTLLRHGLTRRDGAWVLA